jgi:hypothetical protein
MPIPASLYPGLVSIYGFGTETGQNGIAPNATTFLFGVINQMWNGGDLYNQVGQSVMFRKSDIICVVKYDWDYTIIEQGKIILTEDPAAP